MESIDLIRGSDGNGNASVATVQATRSPMATTIQVNTTANWTSTFIATMGTPHTFVDPVTSEQITVISEATAVDFRGHLDGGNIEIDSIAPGYTDLGSQVGDIIIIKPTTEWANNVADTFAVVHEDDGTLKDDVVDTDAIQDNAVTTDKIDDGAITGQKIDFTSTGAGAVWWEELGRTTLVAPGNSVSVSITPKKYLKIIIFATAAGGTINYSLRFNGDTGNNYAARSSINGGADGTGTSLAFAPIAASASSAPKFTIADVINVANQEKLILFRTSEVGTAGAGNLPDRTDGANKWSNTTSQITSVTLFQQGGTGELATGSQILVLGHD